MKKLISTFDKVANRNGKAKKIIVKAGYLYAKKDFEDTVEKLEEAGVAKKDLAILKNAIKKYDKRETKISKDEINEVYLKLKNRVKNPSGEFDDAGRFYAEYSRLMDVRSPSRAYPYPEMTAARTKKFVKALAENFKVQNLKELEKLAFA